MNRKKKLIKNGRRNISKYDRTRLALKKEVLLKPTATEKLRTHTKQGYQKSDKAVHVSKEVAKEILEGHQERLDRIKRCLDSLED